VVLSCEWRRLYDAWGPETAPRSWAVRKNPESTSLGRLATIVGLRISLDALFNVHVADASLRVRAHGPVDEAESEAEVEVAHTFGIASRRRPLRECLIL
jgi:hypothetical protein